MRLTLTLTDQRRVQDTRYSSAMQPPKFETYERANTETDGNAAVIAGVLRALADDIDGPVARAHNEIAQAFR